MWSVGIGRVARWPSAPGAHPPMSGFLKFLFGDELAPRWHWGTNRSIEGAPATEHARPVPAHVDARDADPTRPPIRSPGPEGMAFAVSAARIRSCSSFVMITLHILTPSGQRGEGSLADYGLWDASRKIRSVSGDGLTSNSRRRAVLL